VLSIDWRGINDVVSPEFESVELKDTRLPRVAVDTQGTVSSRLTTILLLCVRNERQGSVIVAAQPCVLVTAALYIIPYRANTAP
jgi:hypothetical protein